MMFIGYIGLGMTQQVADYRQQLMMVSAVTESLLSFSQQLLSHGPLHQKC